MFIKYLYWRPVLFLVPSLGKYNSIYVANVAKVRSCRCSVRSMNAAVSSAAKSGPCHVTAQVAAGAGRGGGGGKYGGQVGTRMRSQSGERYNQIGVIWSLQHRTYSVQHQHTSLQHAA